MMKTSRWLALVLLFGACGGGGTTTSPTPTDEGFLTGRWTGTVVIRQTGIPDSTAATEWRLNLLPNSGGTTFTGTAVIHDNRLPATVQLRVTMIRPEPGAAFGASGFYPSPLGCSGLFGADGTATATEINATSSWGDCDEIPVFRGTVRLTKAR